jgi:phospholipid transport system substrate-binding protein
MSKVATLRFHTTDLMPRIFGAVVVAIALFLSTSGARAETPTAYMQRVADELLAASRSASRADFVTVIRSHADIPSIGITALGSYASSLRKSDRPAYYSGMINFIARYAAKEAPKYPVARAIIVGRSKETVGGLFVDSRIIMKSGEKYDVRWRLMRRGRTYKVREAEIIGFEMTSFLNNMFQNYISDNGGNPRVLVTALNR